MKNKVKCSRNLFQIILKLLFIACIVVPSSAAIPARALPEFTGDWYTDISIKNFDACNNPVLIYNNKMSGSSEALAKKLLNDVPVYSCRDNEGKHCSVNHKLNDTPPVSSQSDKYQLQSVFAGHILDIRQADYSTYTYVHDVNIPRAVKVNQLWSLAIRHQDNPAKFGYLVDIMGSLKPIELVPEIIQAYQHQTDTSNQHHLLSMLVELLYVRNQPGLPSEEEQLPNIIKVQNFFRDLLYQCKNPDHLNYAIRLYPSIASPSDAERDIQYALSRKDIKNLHGNILTEEELIMTELSVAFMTRDQQKKLLPQLIQKYKANRQFSHSLCFMLSHMSPDKIDNSIKEKLANLLERQRDKLMEPTINQMLETQKNPESDWFIAYTAVKTHLETEKEKFMLNYIRNEPDIFMQAGLLSQMGSRRVNKVFSAKDKAYYRNRFFEILQSPPFRQDRLDGRSLVLKLAITVMRE